MIFEQAVEVKMNSLREKVGQLPSIRASMLITEEDELMFEDGKISLGGGTESERSSLSEGGLEFYLQFYSSSQNQVFILAVSRWRV